MQHGDLVAEHAPHPRDGLRCEGDFGNEENGALPGGDEAP